MKDKTKETKYTKKKPTIPCRNMEGSKIPNQFLCLAGRNKFDSRLTLQPIGGSGLHSGATFMKTIISEHIIKNLLD